MSTTPDLIFGPDVSASGFTPAGISAFSDLRPAAVIRELIQNSLDAASEAGRSCAKIRFRKFSCNDTDIPAIESYRVAFQQAIDTQTLSGKQKMSPQARMVVKRIKSALDKPEQKVLSITDNGVGLNERRMSALLSDGVSAKSDNAAGTYGNGHSVAIPASDLRYILYGSITQEGTKLAAGHAVLASHRLPEDKYERSAYGKYIESFDSPAEGVPYSFVRDSAIPSLIASEINRIQTEHKYGAAVIIPAFNHFEDKESLWDIVSRAAACNFFQAIHQGQLVVEVEDLLDVKQSSIEGANISVLNTRTLPKILRQYKDEKRLGSRGAFLSGSKANEAYQTLVKGEWNTVETLQGDVSLTLRLRGSGKPSVGLCRNGMWVTDSLPKFQNYFNDLQPFQALILLDPDRRNDFYGLVQEAETPLHNKLELKPMPSDRRKELKDTLDQIRGWIRSNVPEAKTESYSPEDVLALQFNDFNDTGTQGPGGGRQRSFWGSPAATTRRPPTRTDQKHISEDGPGANLESGVDNPKPSNNKKVRRAAAPYFQIASVPDGPSKQRILVKCEHDCNNAELRMFVDENIDATCDRQLPGQVTPLPLSDVSVDGKRVSEKDLVKKNRDVVGISLGNLTAASEIVVETSYMVPDEVVCIVPGHHPTLRVEIASRVETTQPSPSPTASEETGTNSDA